MAIVQSKSEIDNQEVTLYIEMEKPPVAKGPYDQDQLRSGPLDKVAETARDVFGEGMSLIRNCARKAVEGVEKMDDAFRPEELELKIGVNLDSEVGAVIAKASAGAQIEVTMKWKPRGK